MKITASKARSRSASSKTITGFLPPSSKWTLFKVSDPCRIIAEPVFDSPTKATALISLFFVRATPASSPKPFTRFQTPWGSPASKAISLSIFAVTGDNSAGLWTTVHPAARAGATFHVDNIKGVFHGVIIPTGPIGYLLVIFSNEPDGNVNPSWAEIALSAK